MGEPTAKARRCAIMASITYDTRTHEARGYVDEGFVVGTRARLSTSRNGKHLVVEIPDTVELVKYISLLSLANADEDEDAEGFAARLSARDALAEALEDAAALLRTAPRR